VIGVVFFRDLIVVDPPQGDALKVGGYGRVLLFTGCHGLILGATGPAGAVKHSISSQAGTLAVFEVSAGCRRNINNVLSQEDPHLSLARLLLPRAGDLLNSREYFSVGGGFVLDENQIGAESEAVPRQNPPSPERIMGYLARCSGSVFTCGTDWPHSRLQVILRGKLAR
jgi:hypothetical protein